MLNAFNPKCLISASVKDSCKTRRGTHGLPETKVINYDLCPMVTSRLVKLTEHTGHTLLLVILPQSEQK